jgi:hypothetical protein
VGRLGQAALIWLFVSGSVWSGATTIFLGNKSAKYAIGTIRRIKISAIKALAKIGVDNLARFACIGVLG